MGETLAESQAQLNKDLIVKDINIAYKKGGYKLG